MIYLTCIARSKMTSVLSCNGPVNISIRFINVILLHSVYCPPSPTFSFISNKCNNLNIFTNNFPIKFNWLYLNLVVLIPILSVLLSYLKKENRVLKYKWEFRVQKVEMYTKMYLYTMCNLLVKVRFILLPQYAKGVN
jgi:hypothetical protein